MWDKHVSCESCALKKHGRIPSFHDGNRTLLRTRPNHPCCTSLLLCLAAGRPHARRAKRPRRTTLRRLGHTPRARAEEHQRKNGDTVNQMHHPLQPHLHTLRSRTTAHRLRVRVSRHSHQKPMKLSCWTYGTASTYSATGATGLRGESGAFTSRLVQNFQQTSCLESTAFLRTSPERPKL